MCVCVCVCVGGGGGGVGGLMQLSINNVTLKYIILL